MNWIPFILRGINFRLRRLESRVSQLSDYVDAVNNATTEIGNDVKTVADELAAAISSGDPTALANMSTAVTTLQGVADSLHAVATGSAHDPLPAPPAHEA